MAFSSRLFSTALVASGGCPASATPGGRTPLMVSISSWGQVLQGADGPWFTCAQVCVPSSCLMPSGFAETCPCWAQQIQPGLQFGLNPFSLAMQRSTAQQAWFQACPWSWIKGNYTWCCSVVWAGAAAPLARLEPIAPSKTALCDLDHLPPHRLHRASPNPFNHTAETCPKRPSSAS